MRKDSQSVPPPEFSNELRLRAQAALTWEKEARVLRRFGLAEEMSVVEFGCGPGYTTEKLAALVPLGSVTAIDSDPLMVRQAGGYLEERGASRITMREASVLDTSLPDCQFDFVVARFLFEFLTDPLAAVNEAFRVLKPGGRVVISDSDEDHFYLADPPFRDYQRVLEASQQARPPNRNWAKKRVAALVPLLKRSGFLHLDLETVVAHSEELDLKEFLTVLAPFRVSDHAARAGHLTPMDAEMARRGIEAFFGSDTSFFALILFMLCGEKPG